MSGTLRVLWTVLSSAADLKPVLRCSRCAGPRAFASSGKFRLNANGRRLDAWLIYRCTACDASWNRPVFERKLRAEIDGSMLDALHRNDPALARVVAADAAGLSRLATRIEVRAGEDHAIERSVIDGDAAVATRIEIVISCVGTLPRTDRLLALGLGISRARLSLLAEGGRIEVAGGGKGLSRPPRNGAVLSLDVAGMADAAAIAHAAAGLAQRAAD